MKKLLLVPVCLYFLFATSVYAEDIFPGLNAKSLFLLEASGGEILYEYNADEKLPIASVTKIMTMLLTAEAVDSGKISREDLVPVSERAMSMGGSTMFLEVGEQLTVNDMLKGIAVASANDGAVAMAEFIAGSESAFVGMMNEKATELGMTNTHFVNTNGLDADGHYSTARDVAVMSRELLKHEMIFDYTTIRTDSLRDGKFSLVNTNKLIRFYPGANGLKTGSTSKALCCISASAKRDGMQLVAVVLGAPNSKERFAAARALLDYGFAGYAVEELTGEGDEITSLPVLKGTKNEISLSAEEGYSRLVKKESKGKTERKINVPEYAVAPIKKGDVLGSVEFYFSGSMIKSVNLTASEDAEKRTYLSFVAEVLQKLIMC